MEPEVFFKQRKLWEEETSQALISISFCELLHIEKMDKQYVFVTSAGTDNTNFKISITKLHPEILKQISSGDISTILFLKSSNQLFFMSAQARRVIVKKLKLVGEVFYQNTLLGDQALTACFNTKAELYLTYRLLDKHSPLAISVHTRDIVLPSMLYLKEMSQKIKTCKHSDTQSEINFIMQHANGYEIIKRYSSSIDGTGLWKEEYGFSVPESNQIVICNNATDENSILDCVKGKKKIVAKNQYLEHLQLGKKGKAFVATLPDNGTKALYDTKLLVWIQDNMGAIVKQRLEYTLEKIIGEN